MAAEHVQRIGERIQQRRMELDLTQEEVARAMPGRMSGNRVSLWENGKHKPYPDNLEALAKVLKVDVSYFMIDEPDKTETPDLFVVPQQPDAIVQRLASIEQKLDQLLRLAASARRAGGGPPAPGGILGEKASGSPPKSRRPPRPQTQEGAERKAGNGR